VISIDTITGCKGKNYLPNSYANDYILGRFNNIVNFLCKMCLSVCSLFTCLQTCHYYIFTLSVNFVLWPFSKIHKRINAFAMRLYAYKRINTMILEHPVCQCVCYFGTDLKFSMQYGNNYKLSIHLFIPEFTTETCERSIYI
jgi:hypothetical protein